MKKLLMFFSVFVLGMGSSFELPSCSARVKHIIEEEEEDNPSQDIATLNAIKAKVNKTLTAWWTAKAMIDINDFPEQEASFNELVAKVTEKADLTLTGEEIKDYRFLNQLISGFKVEFDNLNQDLQNQYSNYYRNTMPLMLANNDLQFILKNLNFNKIAKLLDDTSQAILGITLQINIRYEVSFKHLQAVGEITSIVIISNNLNAVNNIQDKMTEYFLTFIDNVFREKEYRVISSSRSIGFNDLTWNNIVWPIIAKALGDKNILFNGYFYSGVNPPYTLINTFIKSDSVLSWAGEGYDPKKLTVENFLKFYKKINNFNSEGNFYLRPIIRRVIPSGFLLENLPLKESIITLKTPIKILMPKAKFEEDLTEFAKVTMDFWHYYKLETYNKNHKLIFNMTQDDFNILVSKVSTSKQNLETFSIKLIFNSIFSFFKNTLNLKNKFETHIAVSASSRLFYKFNWTKNKQSLTIQALKKWEDNNKNYPYYDINFAYNSFAYSFFFIPDKNTQNLYNNEFQFLQIIEFKVT